MLKLMIKKLMTGIAGFLRPAVKVKLTRKNLFVWLPASQGGDLHVLQRPGLGEPAKFSVSSVDGGFALQMTTGAGGVGAMSLATFTSEPEARKALAKLNKALTGTKVFKWAIWALCAWFAWLFITSYLQIASGNPQAGQAAEFAPPAAVDPQSFPSVGAAEGVNKGDLSNYIYQQAMAAKAAAEHNNMPPKSGGDTAGLDGFGLKSEGQSGPGCDPGLAFKVK